MKKLKILLFTMTLPLFLNLSCERTLHKQEDFEKLDFEFLETEVRNMYSLSTELFRAKNLDGLVDRFINDGTLKLPENPILIGHDVLRNHYEGVLQLENFDLNLEVFRVEISKAGDMAWALATFNVSFNIPDGLFSDQGVSLMTFHRINGKWKIASENLSSGV